MFETIRVVSDAIEGFGQGPILSIAILLASAGALSMIMLQILKEMTPIRRIFQKWWLRKWIGEHFSTGRVVLTRLRRDSPTKEKWRQEQKRYAVSQSRTSPYSVLIDLATGGDEKALFDLPTEQVVAQINAAAQIVLDYPARHSRLLITLAAGVSSRDINLLIRGEMDRTKLKLSERPEDKNRIGLLMECRNRVSHRIQRNLDSVQIAMGNRWRWLMQLTAIIFSVFVVEVAVFAAVGDVIRSDQIVDAALLALIGGIAGGYLAPVTRDVVAIIEGLRK